MASIQTERRASKSPATAMGSGPERRCLVTRESQPIDRLIRFVAAPDGQIVADIEGRLPGRGLWLTSARDIVDRACRQRAFSNAVRGPVAVDDRLSDTVERLLVRRCLELLGLARRAGEAVTGFEKVRALLTAGKVGFVFAARDAAHDGRRKISAIAPDVPSVDLFSSSELGGVFGRDAAIHVAVARGAIATKLLSECRRLAGFRMAETV